MKSACAASLAATAALAVSVPAEAQPSIEWYSIDSGGGASSGGGFELTGTIGQHDAGTLSGGAFSLVGGFWAGETVNPCPADLDDGSGSGSPDAAVTIDDLLFFLVAFEAGSSIVDLDNDGDPAAGTPDGAVTIDDLLYFLFHFEAGC